MDQSHIRNFAIIAHIDHGKSTLADRLLELTGTVQLRDMKEQLLDSNPIERERGITIKLAPVRMVYLPKNLCINPQAVHAGSCGVFPHVSQKEKYILNLIDTPGHVDFSYEVSRSLAACEGALLVVDATQGIQAQTLANLHQARAHKLTIVPIINKIDLPNARAKETERELEGLGFRVEEIIKISAKTGENVEKILEAIVRRIPAPSGNPQALLRALVFSSHFDAHKGVVVFVKVSDGAIMTLKSRSDLERNSRVAYPHTIQKITFMVSQTQAVPVEIGYFCPKMMSCDMLYTGEVGYIATGLKDARLAKVGDTITLDPSSSGNSQSSVHPLPGYKEPKPMVFVGFFPISGNEFVKARGAMEKLRLSDSAFSFRPISSQALGNGFHCGFLGLLHAEIVQERIFREFGLTMIATSPSVEYRVALKTGVQPGKVGLSVQSDNNGTMNQWSNYFSIQSASEFPDRSFIEEIKEPVMQAEVYSPKQYVGSVMQLCQEKRGEFIDLKYALHDQAVFTYIVPLSEMIVDFFDRLKSVTEGYASLDYEFFSYRTVSLEKVDILVNKEKVDALSFLATEAEASRRGREIVEKLANVIPRRQFSIPIQAAIGGSVIARADVKPFRKDVTQKLYGGDRTRKDKLLEAQKKGKAKMKVIGKVEIPQTAFFEVLKRG